MMGVVPNGVANAAVKTFDKSIVLPNVGSKNFVKNNLMHIVGAVEIVVPLWVIGLYYIEAKMQ